jgi:hypothetical protein
VSDLLQCISKQLSIYLLNALPFAESKLSVHWTGVKLDDHNKSLLDIGITDGSIVTIQHPLWDLDANQGANVMFSYINKSGICQPNKLLNMRFIKGDLPADKRTPSSLILPTKYLPAMNCGAQAESTSGDGLHSLCCPGAFILVNAIVAASQVIVGTSLNDLVVPPQLCESVFDMSAPLVGNTGTLAK